MNIRKLKVYYLMSRSLMKISAFWIYFYKGIGQIESVQGLFNFFSRNLLSYFIDLKAYIKCFPILSFTRCFLGFWRRIFLFLTKCGINNQYLYECKYVHFSADGCFRNGSQIGEPKMFAGCNALSYSTIQNRVRFPLSPPE